MKHFSTNNHISQVLPVQTDIFVVSYGKTTAGVLTPSVDAFKSRACAERAVTDLTDEARYYEVVNRSEAIYYCTVWNRKLPTFFSDEYYPAPEPVRSRFYRWHNRLEFGLGSFDQALFEAYVKADGDNRKALRGAFPNKFNENDI